MPYTYWSDLLGDRGRLSRSIKHHRDMEFESTTAGSEGDEEAGGDDATRTTTTAASASSGGFRIDDDDATTSPTTMPGEQHGRIRTDPSAGTASSPSSVAFLRTQRLQRQQKQQQRQRHPQQQPVQQERETQQHQQKQQQQQQQQPEPTNGDGDGAAAALLVVLYLLLVSALLGGAVLLGALTVVRYGSVVLVAAIAAGLCLGVVAVVVVGVASDDAKLATARSRIERCAPFGDDGGPLPLFGLHSMRAVRDRPIGATPPLTRTSFVSLTYMQSSRFMCTSLLTLSLSLSLSLSPLF